MKKTIILSIAFLHTFSCFSMEPPKKKVKETIVKNRLSNLPNEILIEFYRYLSLRELLVKIVLTSKTFYEQFNTYLTSNYEDQFVVKPNDYITDTNDTNYLESFLKFLSKNKNHKLILTFLQLENFSGKLFTKILNAISKKELVVGLAIVKGDTKKRTTSKFTNEQLSEISTLTSLERLAIDSDCLEIRGSNYNDLRFKRLFRNGSSIIKGKLKELCLYNFSFSYDEVYGNPKKTMRALLKEHPDLQVLCFNPFNSDLNYITREEEQKILLGLTKLKYLEMNGCSISWNFAEKLCSSKLKWLNISNISINNNKREAAKMLNLRDKAKQNKNLQWVNIYNNNWDINLIDIREDYNANKQIVHYNYSTMLENGSGPIVPFYISPTGKTYSKWVGKNKK